MNFPLTEKASTTFDNFKKNKKTQTGASPWWITLQVAGEEIDLTNQWPEPAVTEKPDVNPDNWLKVVWEPLREHLLNDHKKSACYVAVEVCWTNAEGNYMSVPVFFKWCPETGVPIKQKMLIGSCFQSVKRLLDFQGTTPELSLAADLDINTFARKAHVKFWVDL